MNETNKINSQIRLVGKTFKVINFTPSLTKFKIARAVTSALFKNKKHKGFTKQTVYIGENNQIRLCIYSKTKSNAQNRPLIYWIHGGGYGMGIPEYDFCFMKEFFAVSDCVIVSPDYTLSYKKGYPKALEDCYEGILWAKENARSFGANPNAIIVGGDSAGGGLSMALCLLVRDKGGVNIAFNMPIYPMIDDRFTKTNKDNEAPIWNTKSNEISWKIYLGEENYQKEGLSYYAAPARCEDYSGLSPMFSYVGDIDPFLAETQTAFKKLDDAGIYNKLLVLNGCFHGFDMLCPNSDASKEARNFLKDNFLLFLNKFAKND